MKEVVDAIQEQEQLCNKQQKIYEAPKIMATTPLRLVFEFRLCIQRIRA